MIKLFAGSMILVASILFSIALSYRKKQEEEFVKGYIDFLNFLSSELTFFKREMKEIFGRYRASNDGIFAKYIEERYINKTNKTIYSDSKTVDEAIKKLNDLDVRSQEKFLRYCFDEANRMLSSREASTKKHLSMTKKLVPLVGLVIFIIII